MRTSWAALDTMAACVACSRERASVIFAAVLMACIGCKSEERKLRDQAEWLCKFDQVSRPQLQFFPADVDPTLLLRPDDLSFLKEQDTNTNQPGLGSALAAAMMPAGAAVVQAMSEQTTCTITSVSIEPSAATVLLKQVRPKPAEAGWIAKIGEIAKGASAEDRLKRAREFVATATETRVAEHTIKFVRAGEAWRADLQLPEKARAAEATEAAIKLARALMAASDFSPAKETIRRALKASPDDVNLRGLLVVVEDSLKNVISGKWSRQVEKDPMTDDVNVTVFLPASNEIQKSYGTSRPILYARCREKSFDVFVALDAMVESDYRSGVAARFRFGTEKAEQLSMIPGKGGESVFFRQARVWSERLSANGAGTFVLEVPLYRSRAVATFDLTGADKAFAEIRTACPSAFNSIETTPE